jgi:anaerobic magnesium-protoporphyrin IX monomethyl ester cyclase
MRILLVQSRSIGIDWAPILPLGLCYLATALADSNHETDIYDVNVSANPLPGLKRLIRSSEPDVIGIGLRNVDTSNYTVRDHFIQPFSELVSFIRQAAPATKILVGGPGFTIYGRQLMERLPYVDYGIFNEGEETVPDLLDNLDRPQSVKGIFLRNNSTVLFTGAREPVDFARLAPPRRDFLDLTPYLKNPYTIGVQTKRGCPFGCIYCTYPFLQGTEVRMRHPEAVLDELEELVKKYSLGSIFFVDSIFNAPPSHAREILEGMLARGLDLKWRSYDELKYFDAEYLKLAKAAGCSDFEFSPDGISRSTLSELNKITSREDIERGYSLIRKSEGVRVSFSFFINGPGDSIISILRVLLFVLRCKLFLRKKLNATQVLFIRIYPNTRIYELALEKGFIRPNDDIIRPVYYNPPPLKYILKIFIPIIRIAYSCVRALRKRIQTP